MKWLLVLVASAAALAPLRVHADTGSRPRRGPDDTSAQPLADGDALARSRFFAGATMYEEGNYEGALAEFEASYAVRKVPVVAFNLGQTLRALFRYNEAVAKYQEYLDLGGSRIPKDRRKQVEITIAELRSRIAPIRLNVEPSGAMIMIDGRLAGTAPLAQPLPLSAGRRRIEITADGFETLRDEIQVVGKQPRALTIRLAKKETAGTLNVRSNPKEALIRIDGLEVGTAPVQRKLPRGGHIIEAHLPGYETYRTSIQLAERQQLPLSVVLEEESSPGLLSKWWFWAGVSAIAIGATVGIVMATRERTADPVPGSSYEGVVELLRSR